MTTLTMKTEKNYNILVGGGLLSHIGEAVFNVCGKARALIVTDTNVAKIYAKNVQKSLNNAGICADIFVFTSGELSKTATTYLSVIDALVYANFTRDDIIIALGGGVVGDVAGFAAATYMRGIRYIQVPTTLLAMIDSSIGGKTGVDLPSGKNLLGAFHQPSLVVSDTETLRTLPYAEWRNGLGEGLKYAVLFGGKIFEILNCDDVSAYTCGCAATRVDSVHAGENAITDAASNRANASAFCEMPSSTLEEFISLCISVKIEIVEADEHEGGLRKLLNLGHTLGHAIEKLSNYGVGHGEAVALGLLEIARASNAAGGLSRREYLDICTLAHKLGFENSNPYTYADMRKCLRQDKKMSNDGAISLVTISAIGVCKIVKMTMQELDNYFSKL